MILWRRERHFLCPTAPDGGRDGKKEREPDPIADLRPEQGFLRAPLRAETGACTEEPGGIDADEDENERHGRDSFPAVTPRD